MGIKFPPKCLPLCKKESSKCKALVPSFGLFRLKKPPQIVDMSYYVTNENSVLNINNAHLKVSGNIQTDVMKLGAIEFAPPASDVAGTVNFTNVTTGATTSSNLNVGGTLMLGTVEVVGTPANTANLHDVVNLGNVTSNTVQFTNATTGIVATGNVEASKFIGDGSLLTGITTIESNVDLIRNTNNTAFINLNSNVVVEFPRSKKLNRYPRVALTQNALNNGYTVTSSTQESSSRAAWKVFNNTYAESDGWRGTGTYSTSDGSFTGTWVDFSSGSQTISTPDRGDWLQIILPEKIRLEAIRLQPRYSPTTGGSPASYGRSEFIRNGAIWGSNDGSSWDKVYTINSGLPGDTSTMTFDGINSTTAYNYFVLVITDTSGTAAGTLASFSEWELFGTPEYDPEAHGTDVVVKSVPNVPNTDWLDIYIDGQDYSTMPSGAGSVLDKSTNNRHGTPSNVTFNSTWKAFEIESASTSNITVPFNSTGGAYVHTIALWFWMDTTTSDPSRGDSDRCLFTIRGSESAGRQIALIVNQDYTTVGFKYDFYGADVRYHDPSVVANKWMHVALTYSGGNNSIESKEIYLNGVRLGVAAQNSNPLNLTGTENLLIGGDLNSGNVSFEGMVANFRMFNRVLSKDEIYQLYAYQKEYFGHGDLSMTLKAGRLGIGTSEPRAMLDVRGGVVGRFTTFLTYDHVVHSSTTFNSSPSWPIGQSLSLVSHTWDMPTEYAALGKGNLNGYTYVSWSGSCPNPWQVVFWIDIYYNGVYMGRGSTNSDVGSTSANHGNTTVALTHHNDDTGSTLDSANVTTGFRLPNCDLSLGSTIKIDLICQRGDYGSGLNVVWTNRNHSAPSSNARDYEQGTTNFFVVLNVE